MDNRLDSRPDGKSAMTRKMFPRYTGPIIKLPAEVHPPSSKSVKEQVISSNVIALKEPTIPPPFLDVRWDELINSPENDRIAPVIASDFWFENPSALLRTLDVMPQSDMNDAERLNAMTRVVIIIAIIMFAAQFQLWWLFLALGLITVIALWYLVKSREQIYIESLRRRREYLRRPHAIIQPILQPAGADTPQLNLISLP
jgi:hypothetical protein